MKPRIAIGITTYKDITSLECGAAVFDAYTEVSPKMQPTSAKVWSEKTKVTNRDEFASVWFNEMPYIVRENRSKAAQVLRRGSYLVGPEWSTGAPAGTGLVNFRPELDTNSTNCIEISHAYSSRVDWLRFFKLLVAITEPAYAMLHLFTEQEAASSPAGVGFERFDEPFSGEGWFTSHRSPSGHWDTPDLLRLDQRRNYRFLPELSWANALGPEWQDNFNAKVISELSSWCEKTGNTTIFGVTDSIKDVLDSYEAFNSVRVKLRNGFGPGAFHRTNFTSV